MCIRDSLTSSKKVPEFDIIDVEAEKDNLEDAMYGKPSIPELQCEMNLEDLTSSTQVPEYGIIDVEAEKDKLDDAMYGKSSIPEFLSLIHI